MSEFTWVRNYTPGMPYSSGYKLLASVPQGSTLRRIRFGWGFNGYVAAVSNVFDTLANVQLFGLVTTVGDGSETPPNAYSEASNQDPPTQRWLWWEGRQPRVWAYNATDDVVWLGSTDPQEPVDAEAMVSAKTIGAGLSVNVWASWQSQADGWDASGNAQLWVWASIAYSSPD